MIVTAPNPIKYKLFDKILFLAGTIDNGEAENWQDKVAKRLEPKFNVVLNPRRKAWDKNADQTELRQQINWELDGINLASHVLFNFLPDSKSPVTMLELGMVLAAGDQTTIIVCPDKFYRSTNIKVTAAYFNAPVYQTLGEAYEAYGW